jgi:hypothetical protein
LIRDGSARVFDEDERYEPREWLDDFLCLRYEVRYPSIDCAFRTKFDTSPGCRNCDQGRFNLKRHHSALARARYVLPDAAD